MTQPIESPPTPESMRENLYTVFYELRMLNEVGRRLLLGIESDVERDACLESFLLHTRNLVEFFEAPNRKSHRHDDLWSEDFLDSSGKPISGIDVGLAEDDRRDLNKYLTHMTTTRIVKRWWKVEEMRKAVNTAMQEFLRRLSPAAFPAHKGKAREDFERLLNTQARTAVRTPGTTRTTPDLGTDEPKGISISFTSGTKLP